MIDAALYLDGVNYRQLPNSEDTPIPTPLKIGTLYQFLKAGVRLEQHKHSDERRLHYTIVMSGTFEIERIGKRDLWVGQGDFVDFDLNEVHSIICVDPGVIFNGLKYGALLDAIDSRIANARQQLSLASKDLLDTVGSIYP